MFYRCVYSLRIGPSVEALGSPFEIAEVWTLSESTLTDVSASLAMMLQEALERTFPSAVLHVIKKSSQAEWPKNPQLLQCLRQAKGSSYVLIASPTIEGLVRQMDEELSAG